MLPAPQPGLVFSTPTSRPVVGQPFPAECTGTVPASLQGTVTAAWIGPDGTTLATNSSLQEATVSLPLTSFELSDSGVYVCQITITSPFLGLPLTSSSSLAITAGKSETSQHKPKIECACLNSVFYHCSQRLMSVQQVQLPVASMQRAWTNLKVSCAFATQDSPAMDRSAQVCRQTQLHTYHQHLNKSMNAHWEVLTVTTMLSAEI